MMLMTPPTVAEARCRWLRHSKARWLRLSKPHHFFLCTFFLTKKYQKVKTAPVSLKKLTFKKLKPPNSLLRSSNSGCFLTLFSLVFWLTRRGQSAPPITNRYSLFRRFFPRLRRCRNDGYEMIVYIIPGVNFIPILRY